MKRIYIILLLLLSPLFSKAQITGCDDPNAANYYCYTATDCMPSFDPLTGMPITDPVTGAPIFTPPPYVIIDNTTCIFYGCTNPNADNYDSSANTDNGSCIISGCTDDGQQSWSVNPGDAACNYNSSANLNDGSCTYAATYYDCNGVCLIDTDQVYLCFINVYLKTSLQRY